MINDLNEKSLSINCVLCYGNQLSQIFWILRSFKTCRSFWKKTQEIFANDIQSLFDATMKVSALKQTSHDMIAHVGKARAPVKELKRFLVGNSFISPLLPFIDEACTQDHTPPEQQTQEVASYKYPPQDHYGGRHF